MEFKLGDIVRFIGGKGRTYRITAMKGKPEDPAYELTGYLGKVPVIIRKARGHMLEKAE